MAASFEERRDEIMKIAGTAYERASDHARAYLAVIDAAPRKERGILFKLVIQCHDLFAASFRALPDECSLPEQQWNAIARRVGPIVHRWCQQRLRKNASVEETARILWGNVNRYRNAERVVALALLLRHRAIPYAPLSDTSTFGTEEHMEKVVPFLKSRAFIDAIGLAHRLCREKEEGPERTAAFTSLLAGQPRPVQELLLHFLLEWSAASKGHTQQILVLSPGGAMHGSSMPIPEPSFN